MEKLFSWTQQTINRYAAAMACTDFDRKLEDILTDDLPKNEAWAAALSGWPWSWRPRLCRDRH